MYEAILKKVKGLTDDSREVKEGYLFVAVKGLASDGHDFISQARANGAKIVVGEHGDVDVKVLDSRKAFSLLASEWFGNPSEKLRLIGVTGTDGKTTTASLVYWVLKEAGKKVGLISTVSAKIGGKEYDTGFHVTSPGPIALHKFLSEMVKEGCEYAVLEVTSHGLDQERVYGVNFELSILTNITHEHLDYHKTFVNYAKTKAKLFNTSKIAILNKEDPGTKLMVKYINKNVQKVFYDKETLTGRLKEVVLRRFKENYNLMNSAAVSVAAEQLGIDGRSIAKAIELFPGVVGRMEEVENKKGIRIIIDFAHTPNALKNVLETLRGQKKGNGKLICVFGCAGERDIKKRPMMGKISTDLADVSIFTAEDPRYEKVEDIVAQMWNGVKTKKAKVYKIYDRSRAISFAINKMAQKGDIVVICGKGHEKSMNYNGTEYPWSDHDAVKLSTKKIAVFGYGIEGKDLVSYLQNAGISPTILDEKPIKNQSLNIIAGKKALSKLKDFDLIFRSPGIYRYRKELIEAEKRGIEISSAIKLFFDECPAKIIGVTGTKGKGTTSTLIYEILKASGKDVHLAGNIGKPYLELLTKLTNDSYVVMELSSFQLIDLERSPHIAVILNVTVDHLDWHKDRNEYINAKKNIVKYQKPDDFAVINADYKSSRDFGKETRAKVLFFSKSKLEKAYRNNTFLRGEHNYENISAAVAVAKILKVDNKVVKEVISNFKGLEHRLEFVNTVSGVSFYNDSFATGPQPTIAAVNSFTEPMTVILGGSDKGLDYTQLGLEIAKRKNVKNIILVGLVRSLIMKSLSNAGYHGTVYDLGMSSMRKIVKKSLNVTPEGGVVVLSPAAASFDMFENYKDRGNQFKVAVRESLGV